MNSQEKEFLNKKTLGAVEMANQIKRFVLAIRNPVSYGECGWLLAILPPANR